MDEIDINEIPRHKRIEGSNITVDCFEMSIKGCSHYFLSHFHCDHYTKLKKNFSYPVYCSKTTAALLKTQIGCKAIGLHMNEEYCIDNFFVKLLEANHCPGAVIFLFTIGNKNILHTGDFRYCPNIHKFDLKFFRIYLDNTYESFTDFNNQKDAISSILPLLDQKNCLFPLKICVFCCTYLVGKEKIFLSVAEYLNKKVQVNKEKMKIYNCYSQYTIDCINKDVLEIVNGKRATINESQFIKKSSLNNNLNNTKVSTKSQVNILDNFFSKTEVSEGNNIIKKRRVEINVNSLQNNILPFDRITLEESPIKVISMYDMKRIDILASNVDADKIIVLCGSGWNEKIEKRTFKRSDGRIIKDGIEIVYFRYSEHSSSGELAQFKSSVDCEKIINTVKYR